MTPTLRHLPQRRLLAIAAAFALLGLQPAAAKTNTVQRKISPDGYEPVCPLGSFHCAPRPISYVMCRPNAMLDFYEPTHSKDSAARETSNTYVRAKLVDGSKQTVYHMEGDVRIDRADQLLQSDTADYNDQTSDYEATGNVRYQEAGQLMSATHMKGNQNNNTSIADDVHYQMLTSHGNGVARQGQKLDTQRSRYSMATYSTCDVGHHVWEFRGKSIDTDKETGVGVAHRATMRVGGVPILYLPRFSFPLDDRRKTGFLFPLIGNTSRAGFEVSTPFYLNIAPNYDATLDPRYYTDRGFLLGGEFRYLNSRGTGALDFEYVPHDSGKNDDIGHDPDPDGRYLVHFVDNTRLWPGWSLNTNINRASDSSYLYDFGYDLYTSSISQLTSSVYLNGGGNWWNASFGGDVYQNVNPFLNDGSLQYNRLPRGTFNINLPIGNWLEFGMQNEAAVFHRPESVEGTREDLYPYFQADFGNQAWFVRPRVGYRYTAYQLDNGYDHYGYTYSTTRIDPSQSPFNKSSPARGVPIYSIDSGLIFDRNVHLFGDDYTQTLEPRLFYLYVPNRDQSNLPLFDTNVMSFDYWQLFSTNRFSGADRQMNANNLTAALSTRFLDQNGVERLSASIGEIRYFTQQTTQEYYNTKPTNWSGSDYVAQLNMQIDDRWKLGTQYQWNPHTRQVDLGVLELQHRLKSDGVLNFSYRFRRTADGSLTSDGTNVLVEQYAASAVYPVSDRWRLVGSWTWSKKEKRIIEAIAGVEYDSCCVSVRLVDRNYINLNYIGVTPTGVNPDKRNNSIMLEFEFKGLGATGTQIDPLLQRDILGYQ